MGKKGFKLDMTSCIGCKTCQIACKDKNNLDVGTFFRKVVSFETGVFPNAKMYHYTAACNHCRDPKCVKGCPTGAMHISSDGSVQHDDSKCIGCKYCTWNCPYGVPQYIEKTGMVAKCNMCQDLQNKGQSPACVDSCVMRCLEIVDLDNIEEDSAYIKDLPILPQSSITQPSILIKPKAQAFDKYFKIKEL